MKRLVIAAALVIAACSRPAEPSQPAAPPASVFTQGALSMEGAFARPPVDGQTTGAAYFVVRNSGDTPDRLIGATSPQARLIELHTHRDVGGMKRMEKVDAVDVPAKGAAVFQPGGLHLMLFQFAPAGESVQVTLRFEKGGEITVPFAIVARTAGSGGTGHAAHEGHEH
jgi:hypothetical protein